MEAGSLDWGLAGKPVIVTGASSGIGAATARLLGQAGASVVMVGRDEARMEAQRQAVESGGGKAHVVYAELAAPETPERIVSETVDAFGGIHGIVHTASLFDPRPLDQTTPECIEEQWRVNVMAPRRAVPSHVDVTAAMEDKPSTRALRLPVIDTSDPFAEVEL